jgi:hypothetical protein
MGFHSRKRLDTAKDCMDEVIAEIESGILNEGEIFMEIAK